MAYAPQQGSYDAIPLLCGRMVVQGASPYNIDSHAKSYHHAYWQDYYIIFLQCVQVYHSNCIQLHCCFGFDGWCCSFCHILVGGMTHYGHTSSANVSHSFHSPAGSQAVTFVRLLAKIHFDDMGCLCSVVFFYFGCGWCLKVVFLSQLTGKLDALPSGNQLQLLGYPA